MTLITLWVALGRTTSSLLAFPAGDTGIANACNVATHMQRSFPIKFGLMVGVAGGVWSEEDDVHLGDVVVSQPRGPIWWGCAVGFWQDIERW